MIKNVSKLGGGGEIELWWRMMTEGRLRGVKITKFWMTSFVNGPLGKKGTASELPTFGITTH